MKILLEYEFYNLLLVLLTCILTDIGGFIFGKIIKGPKLTKLSPNKTYSGMIGSYFFSIFILLIIKFNLVMIINIINLVIFCF